MEKRQFDEFLGGSVQLPRDVQIVKLAAARASEIAAMTYSIENPQQTKLVFQKLPVHMRRRVMSHNAKRMPRRLREAHLKQMAKSGMPPESKRPSRKYRRRGRNLWEERDSRRRGCEWLETHVWHAKRFRMTEKWGWKIGESPNGKGFRASYRAAAEHCLMQDISYYHCLEIGGPEMLVRQRLEEHCDRKNLTFGAKIYRAGGREGKVMFFEKNDCPRSPIGLVNFLWKSGEDTGQGVVWIWSHPLVFQHLCKEIIRSFEFRPSEDTAEKRIEGKSSIGSYANEESCFMNDLSDSLNRFRLTGPLTLAVLTNALRPPNLSRNEENREKTVSSMDADFDDSKFQESTVEWHETFYQDSGNMRSLDVQRECMETLRTLKSPGQLPPNSVIAVTVLDPRFFLPPKRTKILPDTDYYAKITLPKCLADRSPLWSSEMRRLVRESRRVAANNVDKLRADNLVPGVENDERFSEKAIAKIPIMLVQNPGCNDPRKSVGFASGVDVIIPAGWSMAFWQSFVLRCARAGGLVESRLIAFEKLDVDSPESHQPDVPAYEVEALATMASLRAKYFRYPPNRRVNFAKLSITSPFNCEWGTLTREWTSDSEKFHVLRDRGSLETIGEALSRLSNRPTRKRSVADLKGIVSSSASLKSDKFLADLNCLVPVKVSIEGKGRPKNFAIICLPTSQDLATRESKKNWSGPVQKLVIDPNERRRRQLRDEHRTALKRCNKRARACRKLAREAAIAASSTIVSRRKKRRGSSIDRNFAMKKEYREKMEELYLPKCERVRSSCDREVMGYVVRGDFSFSEARGIGIGYVTLNSLRNIIDSRINLILVRNTQTRQYRFARICVLDPYRRFAS